MADGEEATASTNLQLGRKYTNPITLRIEKAYHDTYPGCVIRSITVMDNVYGGSVAAVEHEHRGHHSEVCICEPNEPVQIFDTTVGLVIALHKKANLGPVEKFFRRDIFTSLIFLILVLAAIGVAFYPTPKEGASELIKGLAAIAAGYFFGTQRAN